MTVSAKDEKLITEARKRFKRCVDWESTARQRFVADIKFAEGDSDNRWQWEDKAYQERTDNRKPALTINKTRQSNLQILNDQRQNKSQISIRPVGEGATFKAAQIFEGVVRHIEYQSRALEAYDRARETAAIAPRLSLDPAAATFQMGNILASVAGHDRGG